VSYAISSKFEVWSGEQIRIEGQTMGVRATSYSRPVEALDYDFNLSKLERVMSGAGYWPGNIRELQNFIERSVILTPGNTLRPPLARLAPVAQVDPPEQTATLEETERALISRTLKQTNGIIDGPRGAAALLGVKRTTLYSRMQKLGISRGTR
jgi:DNA-binding NtrC family response regulator